MYSQVLYILDRVPALVKAKPELAIVAPFSTGLEILKGDRAAIAKLTLPDVEKLAAATLTGISVETFQAEAKKWLAESKNPRWKKHFTELTYAPTHEVQQYLRANYFKTFIVTGGGQDFVRGYAEAVYGVPPEQVVGAAVATSYGHEYTKAGGGARLSMLALHDDATREYAYGPANGLPETKVGTLTQALYELATKDGWAVISMKNGWKRIFASEQPAK